MLKKSVDKSPPKRLLLMTNKEPLTDEQIVMLANDAMFDVMLQGEVSGYVSLQDIHLAIGRAIEQAHGIGMKN
jgi:hypothetical protein